MLTFVTDKKRSFSPGLHHPSRNAGWRAQQHPQVRQILRTSSVHPKLTTGAPNDKYEQQADHVADQVMRMPDPQLQLQAQPEKEDEGLIQTKPPSAQVTPLVQRQVNSLEEEVDEDKLPQGKPIQGKSISITPGLAETVKSAPRQLQRA